MQAVLEQVVDNFFVVLHEVRLVELDLTILIEFSEDDLQAPRVVGVGLKSLEKHASDLVFYVLVDSLINVD